MRGANFSKVMLTGADLRDADLCYANPNRGYVAGDDLWGANIVHAVMQDASPRRVDFTGA